ncbi:hypothetical protein JTB14_030983 [Gonioctena quinquepunctata]|nr:hypothetical protein JTB14_030983 [Gonioctena quinquepunctata]
MSPAEEKTEGTGVHKATGNESPAKSKKKAKTSDKAVDSATNSDNALARIGSGTEDTVRDIDSLKTPKKGKKKAKTVAEADETSETISEGLEPDNVGNTLNASKKGKKKKTRKSLEKQQTEEKGSTTEEIEVEDTEPATKKRFSLDEWFRDGSKSSMGNENENRDSPVKLKKRRSKSHIDNSSSSPEVPSEEISKKSGKSPKKESLEEFANSKLDEFLSKKISEIGEESEDLDEEEDREDNPFLDTMAEEGEEDTPSEGSNDIIDDGESINTTESEIETDDDYEDNDSFICNDEVIDLLSGDEYDLGDEKTIRKSRIIPIDKFEGDVIRLPKKEKPVPPKKRSRIIPVSSSSGDESDDDSVEVVSQDSEAPEAVETFETPRNRKSSITIIENINVNDIKDVDLSQRIHHLVDSFCTTIPRQGDISMNLSLEYAGNERPTEMSSKELKSQTPKSKVKRSSTSSKASPVVPIKKPRLSVSLDDIENLDDSQDGTKKRKRLSKSNEELSMSTKSKKNKKKAKKEKDDGGSKKERLSYSEEDLRTHTFSLLNQLITDVKNRPRRVVKPSTSKVDPSMDTSWVVEEADVKPSTSTVTKEEIENFKLMKKMHPKDFRNQMLYDPSRVKRVETKKLLKKKGAYL